MIPDIDNTEIAFRYRTDNDLKRANFLYSFIASPLRTRIGIGAVQAAMALHLPIRGILKRTIFRQFCGGETLEETGKTADMLGKYNVGSILDYGVEGAKSEPEYDRAAEECIRAIGFAATSKNIPFISLKITGYCRFGLLVKKHIGTPRTTTEDGEWKRTCDRINQICKTAADRNVMVLIDAEETWIQEPCNEITAQMMWKFNRGKVVVYNTFQMYCHGTLPYLQEAIKHAADNDYLLGAKLVRGAYMEKERSHAWQWQYADPIQPDKARTDKDYDEAVRLCMQNLNSLSLFIGTHNEQSCLKATELMNKCGIANNDDRVIFSQLFGMSDHISFNFASAGYRVAKYLPYGPVKNVVPYLLRRATENTSVAGQTSRELTLIRKEIKRRSL
ncbi:MAG: proline dehydrogenase family protein [Taibaiella sp.]|nr:proline dehydrogenase family protein [Taibaiella sp.]